MSGAPGLYKKVILPVDVYNSMKIASVREGKKNLDWRDSMGILTSDQPKYICSV